MAPKPALSERRALLRAALAMTAKTSTLIRRKLARGLSVKLKADGSPVTDADLGAEKLLRAEIARRFPSHGIRGEEFPPVNADSELQWLLDPIDGTLGFTRGIPLFGTIVGLWRREQPLVGVIDLPSLGETYGAAKGLGCFQGTKRVRLPAARRFNDELVAVCYRDQFARCGKAAAFDRLMKCGPQVRTYGDCFGHVLAARGSVGAMIDFDINAWDLAASQVLIEEAGGKYVVLERRGPKSDILFGKPAVVDRLVPVLR